jgi:hypothetical protein
MSESKRKYTKKSNYWKQFDGETSQASVGIVNNEGNIDYEFSGASIFEEPSTASRLTEPNTRSEYRKNKVAGSPTTGQFDNIRNGLSPFDFSKSGVNVRDSIDLCQKAYYNFPCFRSTIDLLTDFADSDVYLEGGTQKSRDIVEAWFKLIRLYDLKQQFFREFYRSGNVFLWKMEAKTKQPDKAVLPSGVEMGVVIPKRYLVLNPYDITAENGLTFSSHRYLKVLTAYEAAKLANPKTTEDKIISDALPASAKEKLKHSVSKNGRGISSTNVEIELDMNYLTAIFSRKQDYEPMAVPVGYAVLDDINKKEELKKIDQAIARSIENVVLLVTMGTEPDKGGVNHQNINAMRGIFQNKSVGRVLVSDYTTKADFIIPDLKKVMGKEKYEVLNKDIEQGLQNILMGESKYADTQIKLDVFLQRLQESRMRFVEEFLQPEVKALCKKMGLRSWPTVKMKKASDIGSLEWQKLVTRLVELNILTPEQGLKSMETGYLPPADQTEEAQKENLEQRKKGYFNPITQGQFLDKKEAIKLNGQQVEKLANTKSKQVEGNPNTVGSPSGGRPLGSDQSAAELYSKRAIMDVVTSAQKLYESAYESFASSYKTELDESRKEIVARICDSIVVSTEQDKWDDALASLVKDMTKIEGFNTKSEILDLMGKHQLDELSAAFLYHSAKSV